MARFSLIDSPIQRLEEDSLEVGPYVDAMHRFVKGCETPLTIGVQGDWGIGKTSFLNMLIDKFSSVTGREARCHTIYFNTWQYSQFNQEDMLSLSILRGIVANLQALVAESDVDQSGGIRDRAENFGRFVRTLGNQVLRAQTGIDIEAARKSVDGPEAAPDIMSMISEAKGRFAELVSTIIGTRLADKLVIVIDDLDRLKPIRALEFLEAVKNFLDVPGCVFLIAVDFKVVQRGMEEKLGRDAREMEGKSYFDKIIQVPFNMPTGAFKTDRYVMALLGWEHVDGGWKRRPGDDFYLRVGKAAPSSDDVDFLVDVTRLTVGTNPRSIKRSISYATLLKIILKKSDGGTFDMQDAKLLYALASLQLAWPEVFAHFAENPVRETVERLQDFDFLVSREAGLAPLFERVHNPEEVKTRITAFFDELLSAIDTDGDGAISRHEFKVLPRLMKKANLMAVELEDLDEMWRRFGEMIDEAAGKGASVAVGPALRLFQADGSEWDDRLRLRLVRAGSRLVNVLWEGRQLGSLVTTKKEPLQFYLKADPDRLGEALGQEKGYVTDVRSVGHWGTGDSKIDLIGLAQARDGRETLDRIHRFMTASAQGRR